MTNPDFLVIGGGIAGMAAAYELAQVARVRPSAPDFIWLVGQGGFGLQTAPLPRAVPGPVAPEQRADYDDGRSGITTRMAHRDTPQRIIERAVELFNEHGVSAISLNRVAESLGISAGNLHYHFRTKDDLILAIFDRIRSDPSQASEQDCVTPTLAHMRWMFERYALLVWRYRFFFRELSALTQEIPLLKRRYLDNRRERMAMLEHFFERLIAAGVMHRPTPPSTVKSLVALSWMVCDHWIFYQDIDHGRLDTGLIDVGFDQLMILFQPYLCASPASVRPARRSASE